LNKSAILALSDGSIFYGQSLGYIGSAVGEVVFNTSLTGYQEILTDPSYLKQLVTLTYPHIGNTGVNSYDTESSEIRSSGLIIKDYPSTYSSWRANDSLEDYLKKNRTVAISNIDTRRLTRIIRDKGAMGGCISSSDLSEEDAIRMAKESPSLNGLDLVSEISTKEKYCWTEKSLDLVKTGIKKGSKNYKVVALDYGVKKNILRLLVDRGCQVLVMPAKSDVTEIMAQKPDGIFFSNGPGDPEPCGYAIQLIKELEKFQLPMFGICLGYQLMALAFGASTFKMKFGHHGANHPVTEISSGKVFITSQNHGFAVDESSLPTCLEPTYRSNFDGTLQGFRHRQHPFFGFQGHPEASPGPQDISVMFDEFIEELATK